MTVGARRASARLAARSAVKIRAALAGSIRPDRIVAAYADTHPAVSEFMSQDRARARAWSILHVRLDFDAFNDVMRKHYADYYALGLNDAQDEMAHALRTQKALTKAGPVSVRLNPQNQATPSATFSIDWNHWKPGNEAAALLLRQPSGLKQLLGNIDIVSRGIADTSHDLIGGALANGIALGKTPVEIADDIRDTLSSPERALTIAITEGQRAKIEANVQSYVDNGVEQVQWTVNDPDKCICVDLEGEVRNVGQDFEDGITQPPAHPNCQCDLLPLMPDLSAYPAVDLSGDGEADIEEAVVADLAKYSPDQERDERGWFGSGSSTDGRADRHGHEAAALAETLYSHASRIEPGLTAAMKEMGAKYGLKLEGLKFRLKSQESLTRKIAADSKKDGSSPAEAAREISDANRYTMIAEPSGYRAAAQSVIEDLRSRGYEAQVKNYWQEGGNYKGVNVALTDHEGNKIELQFHTPESFALKENENHPLYEEYRELVRGTPRAVELNNQMVANSARLETPPLLENFGEPKIGKSAIANKLQPGYDGGGGGI